MATPLEDQILIAFRVQLEESDAISPKLIDELVSLASPDKSSSAETFLKAIQTKTGEQPV
jgi:hypothetical protein